MTNGLHVGKLSQSVDVGLPDAMFEHIRHKATAHHMTASEYIREWLFKIETGETYSVHVAKDRAAEFQLPQKQPPELTRNDGGAIG